MRKPMLFFFLLISIFCLPSSDFCHLSSVLCPLANANNITVSNATITSQSTSASTCKVQFDLSWENSWRNSLNYDAAWLFIKYSTDSGTTWVHATLKANDTNPLDDSPSLGYSAGSGTSLSMTIPTDKKGVFLYRSANGGGTVNNTSVQLVWDWSADKLSDDPNTAISATTTVRIKVFAVEMVYIPQGSFYVGDGASDANQFTSTQITTATASLAGGYPSGQTAPVASWPNGYNAFYVMKYELSQGAWVDFFNTLTSTQKTTRDITDDTGKNSDSEVYRNTVSWTSGDAASGANQYVPCNYLSWVDIAAYADWAALRPFTELEFEKAGRGVQSAVSGEYAWGSTSLTQVTGITNSGEINETATNSGNCVYGNHASAQGPLRCSFAATSDTTRVQAGASYYGVMELSGNLWERPVTIGNATGRSFDGAHGDGSLSANGNANGVALQYWPGYSGGEITAATGVGLRGGDWNDDGASTYARTSDRSYATQAYTTRLSNYGCRCARTAP